MCIRDRDEGVVTLTHFPETYAARGHKTGHSGHKTGYSGHKTGYSGQKASSRWKKTNKYKINLAPQYRVNHTGQAFISPFTTCYKHDLTPSSSSFPKNVDAPIKGVNLRRAALRRRRSRGTC